MSELPEIETCEMHTGGEPLRIVTAGYPSIDGATIMDKLRYHRDNLDHWRKFLIYEPRGHYDMYGAVFVRPDHPEAHIAVIFLNNQGYSTMCGHAVIALARYAVDKGLVKSQKGRTTEIQVNIQVPCGLVRAFVKPDGNVHFLSVPSFAFKTDLQVNVKGYGRVTVDVGYGGAFYAILPAKLLGLDLSQASTEQLKHAATAVTAAVAEQVELHHPNEEQLAFLYGTIITDGNDEYSQQPTSNVCVFADQEVDRSPTGSGVTARMAVQYHKEQITIQETRQFTNALTGSHFTGKVVASRRCGPHDAVIVEVSGRAFYTGTAKFKLELNDQLGRGFLLKSSSPSGNEENSGETLCYRF